MKFDRFFELAKEKGIAECQLSFGKSASSSLKVYHHEIEKYTISSSQSITACGIYNGKFGTACSEKIDKDTFEYLVGEIIRTATYTEKKNEVGIFEGSPKYKKGSVFSKSLEQTTVAEKIALLRKIEDGLYAADPRVSDTDGIAIGGMSSESWFCNSYGLKLHTHRNYFYLGAGVVLKQGEETKTGYDAFKGNDLSKFDSDSFVKHIVEEAAKKFGGSPCLSGKYPTVLSQDIAADLVSYYVSAAVAEDVQKHSSFFEGKLHQKVGSSKVTIEEKPLCKDIYFTPFDSEGVACYNKSVIKNGILQTYFYNRETAKKDGVESTGNAVLGAAGMKTGINSIFVKPGKKSFDELISDIKEGVYITDIAGLGTGMNENSGDFSCQAEGYMIENGKITKPLNLITLSGNLTKMFLDCQGFANDIKEDGSDVHVGSMRVKSMSIGGK